MLGPGIRSGRRHTDSPTASACDSIASTYTASAFDSTSGFYTGPACACAYAETKARPGRDSGTDRNPRRDGGTEPFANRPTAAHAKHGERASERGPITVRGVGAEPAGLAVELSQSGCCEHHRKPGPVER